ncbi:MAG: type II secretion system F family protein [Dissulfurispiraceae bacterium]
MSPAFKWVGNSLKGGVQNGEMTASSKDEVISLLRRQGIVPTAVNEKKQATSKFFGPSKKKITEKDLVIFTRQFATLFKAGIPIVQGLDILAKQLENRTFRKVVAQLRSDIETGSTLADAMKRHPGVYNDLYVNMVAAGESGGVLDDVLTRLAAYIEKAMKLKKKVKGAMIYPGIVISVAVLVVAIIMIFVIPVFAKVFSDVGVALPLPTRIVVGMSNFVAGLGGILIVVGVTIITIAVRQYRKTTVGRKMIDRLLLTVYIIGDLLKKIAIARFSRTLGTLIGSGVPILDALDICAKTAGNKVVEAAVLYVKREVTSGKTIAEPLSQSPLFPSMVVQMISVGESTGSLDAMLGKIADFYDDEVDYAVTNLTTALEPALMIFLGVVIGFIVVSLYLPIFKLGQVIGK